MNKIISTKKMTDERKCPVRDNISVEHIAYLTARPKSRGYSFSTDIASLTGCRNATAWRFLPSDTSLTGYTRTKTSFIPHSTNKTTSVAPMRNAQPQPYYLINTGNNEVMRSMIWCDNAFSTEVVPLLKLGGNEVNRQECPVRDNISVEHIAYLTARSRSRGYSISTDIASLTGCCAAKNEKGGFILSAFLI